MNTQSEHDPRCMGCPECDIEWGQRRRKQAIVNALRTFIEQRPGFDWHNYSTASDYRSDQRQATRQLHDARTLLRAVELRDSISADDILREAQSGRVSIEWTDEGEPCPRKHTAGSREAVKCGICCKTGKCVAGTARVDYCTGQNFCVEYRAAVARLMASVLWTWTREQCMPPMGTASATGVRGAASATGVRGAASATGDQGKVMGAAGNALFLVQRDVNGKILHVWAGIAGRDGIKPGTWYTLKAGRPVEVT